MGILEFLINLVIFTLPLGAVLRFNIAPNAFLYIQDAIALVVFIACLYLYILKKPDVKDRKNIKIIGVFILWGFISLVINSSILNGQEFIISLSYLIRFASYVSLIIAPIFLATKFIKSVNIKLLIGGSVFTLLGYIQYFYYPNLRNLYYLGWDDHLWRLFSTFLDPNFAGAFIVLFLLLISQNIIVIKKISKQKLKAGLFGLLWIAALVAILLTHSRSAFIMIVVGLATLLTIHRLYKLMFVSIVIILFLFGIFSNTKIEGLNPFRIASSEARIETAGQAFDIFLKSPIIGVGFNSYRYAQVRYGTRSEIGSSKSNADAGTDNSFLFVLATTGIFGFLIYVYFWVNLIKTTYGEIQKGKNFYAPIVLASIVSLFIDAFFINSLFYAPIMAWVFITIGLMESKKVMV
ncbi:MAG TPA: O-antigen ligase family protein [Patescibacteria group bacterium]|nr:O-antigen ligase family protein [Patescibacteria group bacterium]